MTDFEYREYDPAFIMGFEYDGVEAKTLEGKMNVNLLIHGFARYGPAWIGIWRGRCVGGCGILPISPGVGQTWMFFNKAARPFAKTIVREIKKRTEPLMEEYDWHRLHTFVPAYSEEAVRFAECLGYSRESLMSMFGPNKEDYYVYAKLRG